MIWAKIEEYVKRDDDLDILLWIPGDHAVVGFFDGQKWMDNEMQYTLIPSHYCRIEAPGE